MSSSTLVILDHKILESDHNECVVTFDGHTIHTLITYFPFVAFSWLLSHSFEHLNVGLFCSSEHLVVGLDIEWLTGLEGVRVEIAKDVNKLVRNYGLNVSNAKDLRSLANNIGLEVP
ncbi:hypothetical protein NL676_036984 [Syzygium grande]|nr:hypothetical protein NL676_036983 [Syzygium grande]KAI6676188.1 hypothetical protein NL676_036984 [Syzygium grande]